MSKTFVIGDVHGRLEALKQVLQKSGFNYSEDRLIILGDIADGGYNTYEVIEELLKINNKVFIIGNHDEWFMNHIKSGWAGEIWLSQGGKNTMNSYKELDYNIPITQQEFLNNGVFFLLEDDKLFVHGGINPKKPLEAQDKEYLLWDRDLISRMKNGLKLPYKKVFIGHTTTQYIMNDIGWTKPVCISSETTDLWCLDTGAGWNGKLTIMDVETEDYWQSELQNPAR